MLVLSLFLNLFVLAPVLIVLARDGPAARHAWGADTAARRILGAIYAAILLASAALLVLIAFAVDVLPWAQALLAVQITYKFLTGPLVGFRNPVVVSNHVIALVHVATLFATYGVSA